MLKRPGLLVLALLLPAAPWAAGQAQEFTRQTLVVAPLHPVGPRTGASIRQARAVAAGVRSRLSRLAPRRDVWIAGSDTIDALLDYSGYRVDTVLGEFETLMLSRRLRADEVIVGTVDSRGGKFEVRTQMRLARDWKLKQPLRVVRATSAGAAADSLAMEIIRARSQLLGLRRCENAARASDYATAVHQAEAAIAAYPNSTLARTCLLMSLRFHGQPADSIGHVAEDILRIDSLNIVAAVFHASVLTALSRPAPAALAWAHVIELRLDSLDLSLSAVEAILALQKPGLALESARKLVAIHKGEVRLRRLMFRSQVLLAQWIDAAALGDSLDVADDVFREDSTYTIRYVEALRLTRDTLGAVSRSARAVKVHPGDLGLYLQYVKLITGESSTALHRGLATFPAASELHVLAARASLSTGKKRDAIASLSSAVLRDSTLTQGFLQIAELWFEEGQPDSAVAAIARVPRNGGTDLLRAYTLSKGRQLLRAASDTTPVAWRRAAALFALADSLDSQDDSRSLIAASTMELARTELVAAIKVRACPEATRAHEALDWSATALNRGVGDGSSATELKEAYDALKSSVETAMKVLCTPGGGRGTGARAVVRSQMGDGRLGRLQIARSAD